MINEDLLDGGRGATMGSRALLTPARQEEEMEEERGRKQPKQPSLEQCLFIKKVQKTRRMERASRLERRGR